MDWAWITRVAEVRPVRTAAPKLEGPPIPKQAREECPSLDRQNRVHPEVVGDRVVAVTQTAMSAVAQAAQPAGRRREPGAWRAWMGLVPHPPGRLAVGDTAGWAACATRQTISGCPGLDRQNRASTGCWRCAWQRRSAAFTPPQGMSSKGHGRFKGQGCCQSESIHPWRAMEREEIAAADWRARKRRERRAPTACGNTADKTCGGFRVVSILTQQAESPLLNP